MEDVTSTPKKGYPNQMAPTSPFFLARSARKSAPSERLFKGIIPPRTPSPHPADAQPVPLRYPETLGLLIEVRNAEGKGLGVFALDDVPAGTILLSEAPLVTLMDTGARADPLDTTIAALSPTQRQSFLSLSHFSRNPNESVHRSIVYSNGYSIMDDMATGVFETASRINHSCVPNSAYVWKESIGRMVFWNSFNLLQGEEVTVDYGHKKGQLKRIYGFECQCGGCTEWGSVGSSSNPGTENGDGEKEMPSLDAVIERADALEDEALDEIVRGTGAIQLKTPEEA